MVDGEAAQLSATFDAVSRRLHAGQSSERVLREIVTTAVSLIRGADYAGISVRGGGGRFESPAYTDDLVVTIDRVQQEVGEGPAMDAATGAPVLHIADMEQEHRWPLFAERARELGVRSMLRCRFPGERGVQAALNLHGRQQHVFDSAAIETAAVFAAHASVAFAEAGLIASLNSAVSGRQHIGEATGVLMERHNIGSREAYEMLVEVSRRSGTELRNVAAGLVTDRELPRPHDRTGGESPSDPD
ncbi:ANTAR domain-containing protein [Streptomyces winkii]|uniref:ANTAR domain-containing protein n=1 Tax=Streptomyces winkii TaxID=3051178 RepID=UPI0028D2A260|nr:GAF and ANTAR domain-containing protein [Streptomyces sp. DSM 40971]